MLLVWMKHNVAISEALPYSQNNISLTERNNHCLLAPALLDLATGLESEYCKCELSHRSERIKEDLRMAPVKRSEAFNIPLNQYENFSSGFKYGASRTSASAHLQPASYVLSIDTEVSQ